MFALLNVLNMLADTGVNLTALAVAILGGSFVTGLVALRKVKPEKDAIVVSAAQGAVVVQSSVIDALQEELDRARDEGTVMRNDLQEARNENKRLRAERDAAQDTVSELRRELAVLRANAARKGK